jgi:hypothetical protein
MNKMKIITIPRLYVQWVATTDQGKQVEFLEADAKGEEVSNGLELARVFADNNEKPWIEFYMDCGAVRVPLDEFKAAIDYAVSTVHSERYYDKLIEESEKEDTQLFAPAVGRLRSPLLSSIVKRARHE